MKSARFERSALTIAVACALATGASRAHASAFALIEQNASGLGNAYAGAAAAAEDASTIYYNPSGLGFLPSGKQIVLGADLIKPSTVFGNNASLPSGTGIAPAALRPLGTSGSDAGSLSAVPHFYFAMDATNNLKIGVGVGAPFGLKTEYPADWHGRFQAIKSDVKTLNVNPTVSYKVNDKVALGLGLNYQRIDAEFTNAVNFSAATFGAVLGATGSAAAATGAAGLVAAANPEGSVSIKGSNSAWGYNLGGMFQLTPQTRLGIAYRSAIKYRVSGTATFSGVPTATVTAISPALAAALASGNVSADIKMPDSVSFAFNHQASDKLTVLGDLSWTGWAKIKELRFVRDTGATLGTATPENFRNTLRVGLGISHRYNERWTSKAGIAYDQTPVNDIDRTPRLPDSNRTWLAIGAQYRPSKDSAIDFGYTHLFMNNAIINQNAGSTPASGLLNGTYTNSVHILGVQYSHRF